MSRRAKIALVVVIGVAIGIGVAAATSHKPNPQPVAVAPTSLPPTSTSLVATTTTQLAATSTSTSLPPVTASSSNPDSTLPGRIDDHHPDPKLTPGAIFDGVTAVQVCVAGYSSSVRSVTTATKNKVYTEYGITSHPTGTYEIDHLIALELGGSNDPANLWPEPFTGADNAHDKDKLENRLHADVCASRITLAQAQHAIVRWDDAGRAWPDPVLTPMAAATSFTVSGYIHTPGQMYDIWIHDPTINNGCNEWDNDLDPRGEVDNQGNPCIWNIP